jgi:hypothetical protein
MTGRRLNRFRGVVVLHIEGPARKLGIARSGKADSEKPEIRQMGKCEAYGKGCAHRAII